MHGSRAGGGGGALLLNLDLALLSPQTSARMVLERALNRALAASSGASKKPPKLAAGLGVQPPVTPVGGKEGAPQPLKIPPEVWKVQCACRDYVDAQLPKFKVNEPRFLILMLCFGSIQK